MESRLALDPEQPPEVAAVLAELLEERPRPVDPWWQAGVRDALDRALDRAPDPGLDP